MPTGCTYSTWWNDPALDRIFSKLDNFLQQLSFALAHERHRAATLTGASRPSNAMHVMLLTVWHRQIYYLRQREKVHLQWIEWKKYCKLKNVLRHLLQLELFSNANSYEKMTVTSPLFRNGQWMQQHMLECVEDVTSATSTKTSETTIITLPHLEQSTH